MHTVSFLRPESPEQPLVVEVSINNKGPYNFILDTGAQKTCIASDACEELEVNIESTSEEGVHAGGKFEVAKGNVRSVSIKGATKVNVEVAVFDFSALRDEMGKDIMGIIGHDFLRAYVVVINYPENTLTLK